jgi:hypothetical protein
MLFIINHVKCSKSRDQKELIIGKLKRELEWAFNDIESN